MLEFLFGNPILAMIIIAVLLSYFRKKKDNPEQDKAPKKMSRGYEPRPQSRPFEDARDILKELSRTLLEEEEMPAGQKTARKPFEPEREAETATSEFKEPAHAASIPNEPAFDRPEQISAALEPKEEKSQEKELEVREQQVIDGIIWSEILGPPRAKKPYMGKNARS